MSHIRSFLKKRIDGVLVLLLTFIVSLSLLFGYLQSIDADIKDYYAYKKTVEKLDVYNQQFDNTFLRSYRYLDNDKVTEASKAFESKLVFLQKNKMTYKFGMKFRASLYSVSDKFKVKTELIEYFKTLNARITNSVYYLYELSKEIENRETSNAQIEGLLSEVLFKVGQVFLDADLNVLGVERDLVSVDLHRMIDEDIDLFYRHTVQFLLDVQLLKNILKENKSLHLDEAISEMNILLEKKYLDNQKQQEVITVIFFVFAFLILLSLIHTYLKVRQNRREVQYLAYHDTLTGLPNRTEFERYISLLIKQQSIDEKNFIIFFIDLDRFKTINDTLGHDVGDEMLIVLAKRISKVLGEKNLLARIGGDEFVAIIEEDKMINEIDLLVREVGSVIREPIHIHDYSLNTTASIGIAEYPQDGSDKNTLLKHADSAMYSAKDKGKNTYAFYTKALSTEIERRQRLEQELVHALEKNEFLLYFQPQYRLSTGDITGVEALVRWRNHNLGNVSPEEFISIAEETGLIIEIGYYIFKEACSIYMEWRKQGIDIDLIAINISSVQFHQTDAFERFKQIIEETGINAKNIEIELTERFIMEYTTQNLTIIDDLRALGCRISIDDFGTGYSSMSYLKSLAIDTIKIDKSFILELPYNQHDVEVSKAIILLSHSLGYEVIAEGIETIEQETLLKENNCDMGQGYYFAKPMSSDEIVTFYQLKYSQ